MSASHLHRVQTLTTLATVAVVTAALLVAGARPASAHAFLIRTSPAAGSRLDRPPAEVVLDFSEALASPPPITIRTASGAAVATLSATLDSGGTRATAALPTLGHDAYLVGWRVVAVDGHVTEGEFAFAVGVAPLSVAVTTTRPSVSWLDALAALAVVGGLAVAVGGLISRRWLLGGAQPAPPVREALAVALAGAITRTILTLHDTSGLWPLDRWSALGDTRPGRFDLALLGVLSVALLALRVGDGVAALVPLVGAAALIAAAGHPGDAAWWASPATTAHILVAGAWVGALSHLTLVARRQSTRPAELLRAGAARYARFAAITVAATLALGTISAIAQLDRPGLLVSSTWGRVLLIKLTLVVAALACALAARRRGLPAEGHRVRKLAVLTSIEAGTLGLVLAASAVLATTTPPATATAFLLGPPPLPEPVVHSADLAGNSMVLAAAAADNLQVQIYAPGGQPPANVRFDIAGTEPDGTEIDIAARSCGPGCATVRHSWKEGRTTLTVTTLKSGYLDGTAQLAISWPPGPDGADLLRRAVAATRTAPRLAVTETVDSGPGTSAGPGTVELGGEQFMTSEPYTGGADDIRIDNDGNGLRNLSMSIPGSNIWVRLGIDARDRIVNETIVDPGHHIERTISYP